MLIVCSSPSGRSDPSASRSTATSAPGNSTASPAAFVSVRLPSGPRLATNPMCSVPSFTWPGREP
jgi:hypothetical protein